MATVEEFVQQYGPTAARAGKALKVDPSILLGQWGLETGWGKSVIPGTHNLGNIKDFSGGGTMATDNATGSQDKYRTYADPGAFADDYTSLIQRKYPQAVGLGDDAVKFGRALKFGGYAEDPAYVTKVSSATDMVRSLGEKLANFLIPAASAETLPTLKPAAGIDPSLIQWDDAPKAAIDPAKVVWDEPAPGQDIPAAPVDPLHDSSLAAIGAGLGAGVGRVALGGQEYLGKGLRSLGADRVGNWLVDDAESGRAKLAAELAPFEKNSPIAAGGGKLGGEIAATLPVGGALSKVLQLGMRAVPAASAVLAPVADAVASAGMRSAGVGGIRGLAAKSAGGAITGGATASLVDPGQGLTGAAVGGALPGVWHRAAELAPMAVRAVRNTGVVSPEVAALAQRAEGMGVRLRPDQLMSSRPIAALSAALDYLPFSGRRAALNQQQKQFNTAVSRTVGENTDNVAQALRDAERRLGTEFDTVLKNTRVTADSQFLDDLIRTLGNARSEMSDQQFGVISKQVENILGKVQPGDVIEADAAYNIKKILDRLAKNSDSTLAHYGRETRTALMDALNRSLPDQGAGFAQTRQQWGNLAELQKLVPRGADGSVSAARLANARNVRGDLGDLADIAAQFIKPRVGDSGTAQRAGVYSLLGTGGYFDPVSVGTGLLAGRTANGLLGSQRIADSMVRRSLPPAGGQNAATQRAIQALFPPGLISGAADGLLSLGLRAAPLVSTGP